MTTVWNTRLLIKSIHHYLILFANTAERLNMIEGISKERLKEYRSLRLDAEEVLNAVGVYSSPEDTLSLPLIIVKKISE